MSDGVDEPERWTVTERCPLVPDHFQFSVSSRRPPEESVVTAVPRGECPTCGEPTELETDPADLTIPEDAHAKARADGGSR